MQFFALYQLIKKLFQWKSSFKKPTSWNGSIHFCAFDGQTAMLRMSHWCVHMKKGWGVSIQGCILSILCSILPRFWHTFDMIQQLSLDVMRWAFKLSVEVYHFIPVSFDEISQPAAAWVDDVGDRPHPWFKNSVFTSFDTHVEYTLWNINL